MTGKKGYVYFGFGFQLHSKAALPAVSARSLHYSGGQHNAEVKPDAVSKDYPVVDHAFDAIVVGAGKKE